MSLPLISEIKALHAELEAKDKEIARLTAFADLYEGRCEERLLQIERQSVLLGKAEKALEEYADKDNWSVDVFLRQRLEKGCRCGACYESYSDNGDLARAVLSELQLKEK